MPQKQYLAATREAGMAFYQRQIEGPVTMLNLLRYLEVADYSAHENLAPEQPISGAAAYKIYMQHTLPFLDEIGSEVLFFGEAGPWLIGPEGEHWDAALLVQHPSTKKFLAFAQNEDYLRGAAHRSAALADSRLLPIKAMPLPR